MKKYLIWAIAIILIEIFLWWTVFYLYDKWFFNDKWENKIWLLKINENQTDNENISIKEINLKKINENLNSSFLIKYFYSWDSITVKYFNEFQLNKNHLLYYFLIKEFTNNFQDKEKEKFLKKLLILFNHTGNWENNLIELNNYLEFLKYFEKKLYYQEKFKDYFQNKWKFLKLANNINKNYYQFFKKIKDFKSFSNSKKQYKKYLGKINEFLNIETNNNYCYNEFCYYTWQIVWNYKFNQIYNYVENAILSDINLINSLKYYWNLYDINYKIPLTVLIIENLRHHTTYKGYFKKFFAWLPIPKLSVMTKFSYWLFWLKLKTLNDIINSKYLFDNKTLSKIRNKFYIKNDDYKYWEKYWIYKFFDENKKEYVYKYKIKDSEKDNLIDYLVKNKNLQIELFNIFLKQQILYRKSYWIDISQNVWILTTLWNLWGNRKPHKNPETWWSELSFLSYKIYFWDLANLIYNSTEMDKIEIILNSRLNKK